MFPKTQASTSSLVSLVGAFLSLSGAMLLAVQLRLVLPFGASLSPDYKAHFPLIYLLMVLVVILLDQLSNLLSPRFFLQRFLSAAFPARRFLTMAVVTLIAVLVFFQDVSQLQMAYFFITSGLICLFVIVLPRRIYLNHADTAVLNDIGKLWQSRALLRLWISYNIRSRYSQTILGILWIILLPLLTALILAVAFTQFLRIQLDVPMVSFFLAGLIPFNLFNMGVLNGTRAVSGKLELVTQVYFPREILVLLVLGEVLVDFFFTFCAMLLINLGYGLYPNAYYLYLPFIALILLTLALGTMLFVSSVSLLVRDIPQLTAVFLQLLFYITPIIYPTETIPSHLRYIFVLNPLAALVQAFRDIVIYARPPEFITLYYPIVLAGVLLYLGYCVFKSVEGTMADMI